MKNLIIVIVLLMVGSSCSKQSATTEETGASDSLPNIVLIHVDDLGWTDVGAFGSDFYDTPHIDALAREGLRFTNSYAAAAICSPTRAAMMTGKYPSRTGITDWIRARFQGGIIPPNGQNPQGYDENGDKPLKTPKNYLYMPLSEVTVAELLKERGYRTAHIGKWHLGPDEYFPEHQGFDVNIGGCDLGQPPSYFDPYKPFNGNEEYNIPNLAPRKEGEYLTDREGDEVVGFIQENKDKPFFVQWASYTVHTPLMGKADLVSDYESKEPGDQQNPVYAAMVKSLDENVGKVVATLDSLGISGNTLVIFTSDNGGLMGNPSHLITNNTPLRSQKGYPYEGGIRVPTIMRWPGKIPQGKETASPMITMDIIPTILNYVDGEVAEDNWDGVNLVEMINNPEKTYSRDLYWHFPHYRGKDVVPYSIVRSGDFKLIHYYDGKSDELYNLSEDLSEKHNLIAQQKKRVEKMTNMLQNWLENTQAKMPVKK
ncbi:sulfatase [Echinicola rosea]|uniref:N-acetylgalactosamine-6-sulfatase n=1 Tax=Echinicola rosea TaxID=1807691 RepID=A0ABQ1V696_9BACT|nr:sulfatase [Echinicola rosea]GGF40957.1 N-acetylgalactosamine-6-sulfatase [Echinicola rosea]